MLPSNRRFVTRIPAQHLELASLQSRHGDLTTLAPCDFNLPADSTIPAPALPQHSLPVASRHPSVQEPYEKRELCPYCSKSFTTRQEMVSSDYQCCLIYLHALIHMINSVDALTFFTYYS